MPSYKRYDEDGIELKIDDSNIKESIQHQQNQNLNLQNSNNNNNNSTVITIEKFTDIEIDDNNENEIINENFKKNNNYETNSLNPPTDIFINQPPQFINNDSGSMGGSGGINKSSGQAYYILTKEEYEENMNVLEETFGNDQVKVRNGDNDDEIHFTYSLIFFILGFFIFLFWFGNVKYLRSRNKKARIISYISIVLSFLAILLFLILIITDFTNGQRIIG